MPDRRGSDEEAAIVGAWKLTTVDAAEEFLVPNPPFQFSAMQKRAPEYPHLASTPLRCSAKYFPNDRSWLHVLSKVTHFKTDHSAPLMLLRS
jgi:hypothetical protein